MSGGMNKNDNADARVVEGYDIPAVEAWIDANTDYFKPPSHGRDWREATQI